MHIATVVKEPITVSWFLLDKETVALLFGFFQTETQNARTRWGAVVARVKVGVGGGDYIGTSWTSKKDLFDLAVGLPLALERALESGGFDKAARTEVWDAVKSDPEFDLINDKVAAKNKAIEISDQLHRRAAAIYKAPFVKPTREEAIANLVNREAKAAVLADLAGVVAREQSRLNKRRKRS